MNRNVTQKARPVVASTGWAKIKAAGKTVILVDCCRKPPRDSQTNSRYSPKQAVPAQMIVAISCSVGCIAAVETLDESQELYTDLGLDSLTLARLLIELESKLGVQLMDEYLMTVDLVHVSDLVSLVERAAPAAKEKPAPPEQPGVCPG